MTPELLTELSRYPSFPRTAAELIRVVGKEGAARLISSWGGQEYPIPFVVGGGNASGVRRYNRLVELIGIPAATQMVNEWGGGKYTIPNLKMVKWDYLRDRVLDEFDLLTTTGGMNSPEAVFELGIKYGVTGTTIEKMLKRPRSVDTPGSGSAEACAELAA